MDNLTHSLVGAALAELALPATAAPRQRRVFFVAGVLAANLPDADLAYTSITAPPLGYLLHHRGHTHTLVGLVAQFLLVATACLLPVVARHAGPLRRRLPWLVGAGLVTHLVLDSWNSYGVHPFWPLDDRWIYGDAIYILEPWLWLPLAVAAALNMRRPRGGALLGALVAAIVVAGAAMGMVPALAVGALAAVAALVHRGMRRSTPRQRSGTALAAVALYVAAMFAVRGVTRAHLRDAAGVPAGHRLLDVAVAPSPANPLCWTALAVAADEAGDAYSLTRARVAPLVAGGCGPGKPRVAWEPPALQSLAMLRTLARDDCRVRAWLQFGRAPEIRGTTIADARFGATGRDNFSAMELGAPGAVATCPANLTGWGMPRADLLGPLTD